MVHFLRQLPSRQLHHRQPGLHRRMFPVQQVTRKLYRPLSKPYLRPHVSEPQKTKYMRPHRLLPPIANIIFHTHSSLIPFTQRVLQIGSRYRCTHIRHLPQQSGTELQHSLSIRRSPLGKEHHRQPLIHRCLHPASGPHRRPTMPPFHVHRSRHRRHPPHYRPVLNLQLRHKHARAQRRKYCNIHVAQMV